MQQPFGIPLDTRHTYTKTDWEIWTAAIVSDTAVRNFLITSVKRWASEGFNSFAFGDWYETTNGAPQGFRARPVVGGHRELPFFLGSLMLIRLSVAFVSRGITVAETCCIDLVS